MQIIINNSASIGMYHSVYSGYSISHNGRQVAYGLPAFGVEAIMVDLLSGYSGLQVKLELKAEEFEDTLNILELPRVVTVSGETLVECGEHFPSVITFWTALNQKRIA